MLPQMEKKEKMRIGSRKQNRGASSCMKNMRMRSREQTHDVSSYRKTYECHQESKNLIFPVHYYNNKYIRRL